MSQMTAMNADPRLQGSQAYRDGLGVAASVLCAIHCAAMPFVVGFLPLLGLSFLAEPSFHKWMVGICLGFALIAFVPGWRRHQRLMPALIGLGGLGLISFAAFAGPDECCPTPCGDASAGSTAMMPATAGVESCDSGCCDTTMAVATVVDEDEEACTASCCATNDPTAIAVADDSTDAMLAGPEPDDEVPGPASEAMVESPAITAVTERTVPTGETPCTEGCCPESDDTIHMAGSGDFMSMFWLLMTPIGGVILVVAHLTNHRLTCRCKAGCCDPARDAHAAV